MSVDINLSSIFLGFLTLVVSAISWFVKMVWNKMEATQKELTDLKVGLPVHYVRHDDFRYFRDEIMETMKRIEGKLDQKANKEDLPKD